MHTRKPAETRKTEIIDAALQLAHDFGPDRMTTLAIADAVGLSQAGVFRYYPKKQDLWEAVAAHIGELMKARWTKVRNLDVSPTEKIRRLISVQLRLIQSTPAIPAILFSRESHTKNKGLRIAFRGFMGRFHRLIAELVADAGKVGELRDDLQSEDAAFLILGLVQGLAVRWSISGMEFSLAEEGKRLLELQLSGFSHAAIAKTKERAP